MSGVTIIHIEIVFNHKNLNILKLKHRNNQALLKTHFYMSI